MATAGVTPAGILVSDDPKQAHETAPPSASGMPLTSMATSSALGLAHDPMQVATASMHVAADHLGATSVGMAIPSQPPPPPRPEWEVARKAAASAVSVEHVPPVHPVADAHAPRPVVSAAMHVQADAAQQVGFNNATCRYILVYAMWCMLDVCHCTSNACYMPFKFMSHVCENKNIHIACFLLHRACL